MNNVQSLKHTVWDCKNHILWIPKSRKKTLYDQLRQYLGEALKEFGRQKESKVLEGHLMPDHTHILISNAPKYAVSQVVDFIKSKSAIHITRASMERKQKCTGQKFWAGGYYVPPVGDDEETIREYIQKQEAVCDKVSGRLLEPENPFALAEVIREFLNVPPEGMKEGVQETAEEMTWENLANGLLDAVT